MKTGRYINYQQFFSVFLLGSKSQREKERIPPILDLLPPRSILPMIPESLVGCELLRIRTTFSLHLFAAELVTIIFFPPNKSMFSFKLKKIYNCQTRPDHLALHPDCDGDLLQLFQGCFFPPSSITSQFYSDTTRLPSPPSFSKRIYSFPISAPPNCAFRKAVKESASERAPLVIPTFHDESKQRKRAPCHTRQFSTCPILAKISWDKFSCLHAALRVLQPLPHGTAGMAIPGS